MKSPVCNVLFVIVLSALVLAACGAPATQVPSAAEAPAAAATAAPALNTAPEKVPSQSQAQKPASDSGSATNTLPENATIQTGSDSLTGAQTGHMIIKNAEIKLLVEKTDTAIDRSMQVVGDVGGYIISSKVWYQDANGEKYKYATISIGVPVDQFETAMRRLRGVALRVLDENASGQDVTSEYVDLQSQLGNLEATRDRIRSFLDNAQSVEESLRINQELTTIEAQIEQVKGRMNFLSNRSAYSTITINLEPDIPPVTPTATPIPMPTATPESWNPGKTVRQAAGTVTTIYQGLIELAIWVLLVVIPLMAPIMLAVWGIYKFSMRKAKKTETSK